MRKLVPGALLAVGLCVIAILALRSSGKKDSDLPIKPLETGGVPESTGEEAKIQTLDGREGELADIYDQRIAYGERLDAISKLDSHLTSEECAAALRIIHNHKEDEAIRNDLMVVLEKQSNSLGNLAGQLVQMWQDKGQSEKWRDYCLQHMAEVQAVEPQNSKLIVDTLTEVAKGGGTSAETAMLSLERIGERDPKVLETVKALAFDAIKDMKTDQEKSVVAFQIAAGGDKAKEMLPKARELSRDTSAKARLRMSAMSVIGNSGDKEDIALLEELSREQDKRIAQAAKLNLKALRERDKEMRD